MCKAVYRYFILQHHWVARLKQGKSSLDPKEFYKKGKWEPDNELNLKLNDCIMDYGDYRWNEYDEVSEDEAIKFINQMK